MSMLPGSKEVLALEHSLPEELGPQGVSTLFLLRERRRTKVFFEAVSIFRMGLALSGLLRPPIARRRKFLDLENRLSGIFGDPSGFLKVSGKCCMSSISEEAIESRVPLTEYLPSLISPWSSV